MISIASRLLACALLSATVALAGSQPADHAQEDRQTFVFKKAVANVDIEASSLRRSPPPCLSRAHASGGNIWYGEVLGRTKAERQEGLSPLAGFEAVYDQGRPISARYDANADGDLTNDPDVKLFSYPPIEGARSFLASLQVPARAENSGARVEYDIRVVLQPQDNDRAPLFRAQVIHAMTGEVTFDGKTHKAFLLDARFDGIYTRDPDSGDGLYVDLDDDGRIAMETPVEFVPFSRRIHIGPGVYEIVSLDPRGASLEVKRTGTEDWVDPPKPGRPAPDFTYTDTSGRRVALADYRGRYVLVYFWASWCTFCRGQADGIKMIYDRFRQAGFEILGVSADNNRENMEAFRTDHGFTWPTSFSGIRGRTDPVIALYRPRGTGSSYLIAPDGTVEGVYEDMGKLEARLEVLLRSAVAKSTTP